MCGRFSNRYTWKQIHEYYSILKRADDALEEQRWQGMINIPPTVSIPVIRSSGGVRRVDLMRWGMVAPWAKEIPKYATHNARLDSVAEKATFKNAWKKRQCCLVPAEAFYEWRKPEKTVFAIGLANGGPVAMAGLWEHARIDGGSVLSCTLLTTEPNALLAPIHDRMPVFVGEEDWGFWLGEKDATPDDDVRILAGMAPERMRAWQVSQKVGSVQCKDEDLLTVFTPRNEGGRSPP